MARALAVALSWLGIIGGSADEIQWSAPGHCPAPSSVMARFNELTARDDALAGLEASADVDARPDGTYEARVRLRGVDTSFDRVIVADECSLLAEAVALVIAVHADAIAVAETTAPSLQRPAQLEGAAAGRTPTSASVSAPSAPAPPRRTSSHEPASREAPGTDVRPTGPTPLRGSLRLAGGVAVPLVPEVTPTFEAEAALQLGRLRLEVLGTYAWQQPARLDRPDVDAGADIDLATGALRVAFVPAVGRFEFPLHAGLHIGDLRARGRGVRNPRTRHGLWIAADAGAGVAFVAGPRVAIAVRPSLIVPLRRPTFGVRVGDEGVPLFEPAVAGFRMTFGPELRFP